MDSCIRMHFISLSYDDFPSVAFMNLCVGRLHIFQAERVHEIDGCRTCDVYAIELSNDKEQAEDI